MKLKLLCGFALLATGFVAGQMYKLPEKAELLAIESPNESADDPVAQTTIVGLTSPAEFSTVDECRRLLIRIVAVGSKIGLEFDEPDDGAPEDETTDEIKVDSIFTPVPSLTNGAFVIGSPE